MAKHLLLSMMIVAWVTTALGPAPAAAQTCGPLDNGRLADVRFGSFTVERGVIVDPGSGQEKSAALADRSSTGRAAEAMLAGALGSSETSGGAAGGSLAPRVVLTNSDGVIRNSLCVGFDCPNSPTFSDTTILMMENNTRIKFDDTSTLNSFPRNDWEIEANSRVPTPMSPSLST